MNAEKVKIPVDVAEAVEEYIPPYREYKELESKMKKLRKQIEPFMKESGIEKIEGSEGAITIEKRNIGNTTANYSTYDPDIVSILSPETRQVCVVEVVDRDKLEAMATLGVVDKEAIKPFKKERVVPCFTVNVD